MIEHLAILSAVEAEKSLLSCAFLVPDLLDDFNAGGLVLQDFHANANRIIYGAMAEMRANGKPIAPDLVAERLLATKQLDEVGGVAYLYEVMSIEPTAMHATEYLGTIKDRAVRRRLVEAATVIGSDATDLGIAAADLLGSAERRLQEIGGQEVGDSTVAVGKAGNEYLDQVDAWHSGAASSGLLTGFLELDRLTAGLHRGDLILVAARPSVGKTALGVAFALQTGVPVLFVSLEQSRREIAGRAIHFKASVSGQRARRGQLNTDELNRLVEATGWLKQTGIFIDDRPDQNVYRIAANARRHVRRHGVQLVIIDYLQLIAPEDRRVNRQEQVAAISRRLKILARELNVPVVAMAQLNRAPEDRADRKPRLSDLRESGSQEMDADVVILLYRDDAAAVPGTVEAIVAKQRNGPVGAVPLHYRAEFMRFENANFLEVPA